MVGPDELVKWFTDGIERCTEPKCKNARLDFVPLTAPVQNFVETEPVDDYDDVSMF